MSLTGKEVAEMHKQYIMQSWSESGGDAIPVERAEGIYFWDYDGKKYADMASLLVCSNLGHELPEIVEAIKAQADKMCFMAPAYASEPKSMLAKMLVEAAETDTFKRVFFTNGGAESNENAIKMARMVTGRTKIFSCYHGATLAASNASGDWQRFAAEIGGANGFVKFMNPQMYRDGYTKGVDDAEVTKKALTDLDLQLRYEGPGNVAAILMESIVGANGVILPPDGYMEGVRALCDKYGILLICDEVMVGFFRIGKWFAWQNFDMRPDLITFAKGVTYLLALVLAKIISYVPALGSTFSAMLFMWGMFAAYIVKAIMRKLKIDYLINNAFQSRITGFLSDYLVVCSFMAIQISVIGKWIIPIIVVSVVGTVLLYMILVTKTEPSLCHLPISVTGSPF